VRRWILPVAVLALLALLPRFSVDIPYVFKDSINTPGTLQLLALCLVFGGLAMTYDLLFGYTGLLSFGHALYFALGVYLVAIAITKWHWGFYVAVGFTLVAGLVVALVLGAVSLRVGGIAFAMVTLAFAQAGSILVFKNPQGWTGGEEGLGADYTKLPATFVGIFNTKHLYLLALAYAAIVFAIVRWAVASSPGHIWQAIRENELRVEVLGLRPYAYKLIVFVLASILATVGGVVYLLLLGGATPEVTSANFTLTLLIMVVIGAPRRCPLHMGERTTRRRVVVACRLVAPVRAAHAAPAAAVRARRAVHPRRLLPARRHRSRRPAARGGAPVRIAWEERGSGRPLLLIQGLGYARWSWEPVVPLLAEQYRVLFFDNRGIGESDKPEGPYSARVMADDALQVLDDAGVDRAHVLGASLGGMIAQELAVAAPERVDKLVLCCTTPGGAATVPMPQVALRRFVENALSADAAAELVQEIFDRRVANPLDPAGWQAQAAAGLGFQGVDGAIAAPTLIVTGTDDNVVDPRNADVLAEQIPAARLERIDGAGHLFFWEQPDRFVRIVREFLQ